MDLPDTIWIVTDIAGEHVFNVDTGTFTPVKDFDARTFQALGGLKACDIIRDQALKGGSLKMMHYDYVLSPAQIREMEMQCEECHKFTPADKGYYPDDKDYGRVCRPCYEKIQAYYKNENK